MSISDINRKKSIKKKVVTLINPNFRLKSMMIASLIVIDYYRERLKSFGTSSTLVSLSHSIMVLCSFLNTDEILKRRVCTVKKHLSPTKYNLLCQKMAAFWRSSVPNNNNSYFNSNIL